MWNDIRYGFRSLLKSPGFSIIVILTLAVGIGLTSALFTIVNGVLLRPLPYRQPNRLMILWEKSRRGDDYSVAYQNFLDWRKQNTTFESLAASRRDSANFFASGQAEIVHLRMVSSNLLSTLGVQPFLGRDFRTDEDRPNAPEVAILTYPFWKSRFHGDPKILGRTVRVADDPVTIIGVLPEHHYFMSDVDLYIPIGHFSDLWPRRDTHPGIYVYGRLRSGVTTERAQSDMNQIAASLEKEYPATNSGLIVHMEGLAQHITVDVRPALWLLFGAVSFVLLIGCANIANMMLARGMKRQKEISIRMALGANRMIVIREFLTESLLLSFAGGIVGLLIAQNVIDLLVWLRPENLPRMDEIKFDWMVLGFSFCVSALSGILFGLYPAFRSSKIDLQESMKQGVASTSAFQKRFNVRSALVISQVTLSLLLLIGAGLMIKSLITVIRSKPGFDPDRVLTMAVALSPKHYQGQNVIAYLEEAGRRIERLPGVKSFAYTNGLPFANADEAIFWVEDRPRPAPGKEPRVVQYIVSPNYFETLKIPLLKGRYLLSSDLKNQTTKLVIDEMLATKFFPDRDPLGKFLRLSPDFPPFEIVGVVGHVKHYGLDVVAPVEPEMYFSVPQVPDQFLSMVAQDLHLLIRTSGKPQMVADSVMKELAAIDPQQPIMAPVTMQQMVDDSLAARRFTMMLLTIFAAVALFLAAAGIYGVLSYSVVQRSKEIGIRMAIGAKKADVFRLMLSGGFRLIVVGLMLGILSSLALSKLLTSQLYGVSATDPSTLVLVSLLLCSVGLAATYVPASRAMKVDPLSVLKYE